MLSKKILLFSVLSLMALSNFAQSVNLDSLLDSEMDKKNKNEVQYKEASFKTGRLINSHTVETEPKGVLDFKISHRFGDLHNGVYDMFGLDNAAAIRFGADYGLTDRLTVGIGRSSFDKEYDAFLKYRLLWQSSGKTNTPVSVTLLASSMIQTIKSVNSENKTPVGDRFSYAFQALVARKFSSNFSMQLMPTMIIDNPGQIKKGTSSANFYSVGIGGRLKLSKRSGIIAEYYQNIGNRLPGAYNPFSVGYETETGGHVFQFILSNSTGITERRAIAETFNPVSINQLHLGFNISRVFTIKRPKDASRFTNSHAAPVYDSTPAPQVVNDKNATHYTQATFTTTRLINGHTVETTQRGVLDLKVTHRFGTINSGSYNLWGLDEASMRIGLDYGITDRLTIGGGRSAGGKVDILRNSADSFHTFPSFKEYDGFVKYKLLRQSSGEKSFPFSATILASAMYNSQNETRVIGVPSGDSIKTQTVDINNSDRYHFAYELILARKFGNAFSLQLMPTMVHYNIVDNDDIPNNLFSIGAGLRVRLTPRSNFNFEYYYQLPGSKLPGTYNSFSFGYELETGGHVFQFQLTNSYGTTERLFITETRGSWKDNVHFGFNIARVFTVVKPKNIQ